MTNAVTTLLSSPELLIPRRKPIHAVRLSTDAPIGADSNYWIFNEGGGQVTHVNLANGEQQWDLNSPTGTNAYWDIVAGKRAIVADYVGNNTNAILPLDNTAGFWRDAITNMTIGWSGRCIGSQTASEHGIFGIGGSVNGVLLSYRQAAGDLRVRVATSSGADVVLDLDKGSAFTDGDTFNVTVRIVGTSVEAWLYECNTGTHVYGSGTLGATINSNSIGAKLLGADTKASGESGVFTLFVDRSVWPAQRCVEWVKNPYAFLEPAINGHWAPQSAEGPITGTGALTAQDFTISGTGVIGRSGTGALTAQDCSISGTGTVTSEGEVTGSGALTAQDATISGTGTVIKTITGTGALTAQASTISGVGTVPGKGGGFGMTQAEQARLERRQRQAWERQARKVRMIREDDEIVAAIIVQYLEDE